MRDTRIAALLVVSLLLVGPLAMAQPTPDPFPTPIPASDGVIRVSFREFAVVPDLEGVAARMMVLVDEPGTRRLFVNDMRGPLYWVSYDGKTVRQYLDVNAPTWGVVVQSGGRERGVQSVAFHPQFNRAGTPGFGKFYTFTDTANTKPAPDFKPSGGTRTHDTVLLEWTAKTPSADVYDGGLPREILRLEQPFANHNGGLIAFNSTAAQDAADYGLLYVAFADGGSGGDPLNHAQNLGSVFGKLLRIDPLGRNSANGKYGIPASNPFAADQDPSTLGEIYAYGLRNPQRFTWDPRNGNLFLADIGQNIVEEVNLVTAGANLGWNVWEGSFRYLGREGVDQSNPRGDPKVTYPIVEYGQLDPLLQPQSSVTMGMVYRQTAIKPLTNLLLFGDIPSGEIFYVNADTPPKGGQDPIRRVLLNDGGTGKTLLELVKATNVRQGKPPATRADLRFGVGPEGQVFLLNKGDGVIRLLVPDGR
jgi:Glucose / Sorbosone dehydrogenase